MINIVLYQPKIPQNTGAIVRFCANTGINLHLVYPMAFEWNDKKLKRAGLDYFEFADITHHDSWQDFINYSSNKTIYLITTKSTRGIQTAEFKAGDYVVFGSEDAGISDIDMKIVDHRNWLRIPMKASSRSMNLANTVSIVGFEAMRQLNFPNLI